MEGLNDGPLMDVDAGATADADGREDAAIADGTPPDGAPADGGLADGGLADGATDASDGAVDAGAKRFCDDYAGALWCADFDGEEGLQTLGVVRTTDDAGAVALVTSPVRSPPRALKATYQGDDGLTHAHLSRTLVMGSKVTQVRVSFSARVTTLEADDEAVVRVKFGTYYVNVKLGPGLARVQEVAGVDGGSNVTTYAMANGGYAVDTWTRVVLELTLTPSGDDAGTYAASSVRAYRDGALALTDKPLVLHEHVRPDWEIHLGLPAGYPSGYVWTSYLDDVVVEAF